MTRQNRQVGLLVGSVHLPSNVISITCEDWLSGLCSLLGLQSSKAETKPSRVSPPKTHRLVSDPRLCEWVDGCRGTFILLENNMFSSLDIVVKPKEVR